MSTLEQVIARFAAPIPLGHRVEVVWYQTTHKGWRGETVKEYPHLPHITDLETGVEYLNTALVGVGGGWALAKPREVHDQVPSAFASQRVLLGKVRRCRLITIGTYEIGIQTHLDVEPDPEQPAYR